MSRSLVGQGSENNARQMKGGLPVSVSGVRLISFSPAKAIRQY